MTSTVQDDARIATMDAGIKASVRIEQAFGRIETDLDWLLTAAFEWQPVIPVVAGDWITPQALDKASEQRVWHVLGGRAIEPR